LAKPEGTYRILVLGDSTTFGWGVPVEKPYAKLLEQKLNENLRPGGPKRFEVMNTGVGNYNTAQEVAYFKERGRLYKPDMVILGFFTNDAEETPHEKKNWLARESCLYVFLTSAWDGILRQSHWRPDARMPRSSPGLNGDLRRRAHRPEDRHSAGIAQTGPGL
jgi:hypothetical protein